MRRLITALVLSLMAFSSHAAIIWRGDFETGDFMQYVHPGDPSKPFYWGFPQARWPHQPKISSIGDGTAGIIVTDPVRQGNYSVRIRVRNSITGTEPEDCDGLKCERRRSETNFFGQMMSVLNNGMPYMGERWISISHYVPADWDDATDVGSYINVMQIKTLPDNSKSPTISISIEKGYWRLIHRWSELTYPSGTSLAAVADGQPSLRSFSYTPHYPNAAGTDSGADLRADFPDQTTAQAALADLNKGGWTDWVIHVKFDHRGSQEGGTGFLNLWKRKEGDGWIQILAIVPKLVTRSGLTLDRGVGYHGDGYGPIAGMYGGVQQFWGRPADRIIYHDNFKVGDADESLTTMAPEYQAGDPLPDPDPPPDVQAPIRGNGAPTTTSLGNTVISWQTSDETPPVNCQYRIGAAFAYDDGHGLTPSNTGGSTHSATVNFGTAGSYDVHVMCQDSVGTPNVNSTDWYWTVTVQEPGEAVPGKSRGRGRAKIR